MSEAPTKFYNIKPYDGTQDADSPEHRLVTITFKTPKTAPSDYTKPPNRCISIPKLSITCSPDILKEALQEAFYDLQDDVIRDLILERDAAKNMKLTISDDEISFGSVVEHARLTAQSGKLSSIAIELWFDTNIADKLTVALANALKFPDKMSDEQAVKLDNAIAQHKKLFGKLASHKASFDKKAAISLQKALKLAEEEDKVFRILNRKLEFFISPPTQELLGL